ncbi:unnamed protein product, partial [Didymodactylos carnosus]
HHGEKAIVSETVSVAFETDLSDEKTHELNEATEQKNRKFREAFKLVEFKKMKRSKKRHHDSSSSSFHYHHSKHKYHKDELQTSSSSERQQSEHDEYSSKRLHLLEVKNHQQWKSKSKDEKKAEDDSD